MNNEAWEWVVGFEGKYEVSDLGNIRSYVGLGCKPALLLTPRNISLCRDGRGYYYFSAKFGSARKVLCVHVEVAKAFLPNPDKLKLVRHLNDNKEDNRLSNLAWGGYADNMQDAIRNKRNPTKNNLGHGLILFMYNSPHSACSVARRYNVSPSMVTKIRTGRSYAWLTGHKNK